MLEHISTQAFHEPLVHMIKKYVFDNFRAFFIVFDHANAGRNTQQALSLYSNFYHSWTPFCYIIYHYQQLD